MPTQLPVINQETLKKTKDFLETLYSSELKSRPLISYRYILAKNALNNLKDDRFIQSFNSDGLQDNELYESVFTTLTTLVGLDEQNPNQNQFDKKITAFACFYLGQFYYFGREIKTSNIFFVKRDENKALELFQRSEVGDFNLATAFVQHIVEFSKSTSTSITPTKIQPSASKMNISKAALNSTTLDFNPFEENSDPFVGMPFDNSILPTTEQSTFVPGFQNFNDANQSQRQDFASYSWGQIPNPTNRN